MMSSMPKSDRIVLDNVFVPTRSAVTVTVLVWIGRDGSCRASVSVVPALNIVPPDLDAPEFCEKSEPESQRPGEGAMTKPRLSSLAAVLAATLFTACAPEER